MAFDAGIVRSPFPVVAGSTRLALGLQPAFNPNNPLMTEVNASTHWNQAVALYNRRYNQIGGPGTASYFSGKAVSASLHNDLRNKINTIRGRMGLSSFGWTYSVASGNKAKKQDLDELFSALAFGSTNLITSNVSNGYYFENDASYPTPSSSSSTSPYIGSNVVGKRAQFASAMDRGRFGVSFYLPNLVGSGVPVNASFSYEYSLNRTDLETLTPQLFLSNNDDSAFPSGWQNHLHNNLGTDTGSLTGASSISFAGSVLSGRGGTNVSFVFGSSAELASGGASSGTPGFGSWFELVAAYGYQLYYDFGF